MMRVLAAHQPNYAPYLGFLHKAAHCDVFVVQDDLKYVKNDFGNRNRVQSEDSWRWLTIPLHANNDSQFRTATVAEPRWGAKHANILRSKYLRAKHADALAPYIDLIAALDATTLSEVTMTLTAALFAASEVQANVVIQSGLDLPAFDNPNDRLIELCRRFDCDAYISGTGGRAYIDEERWVSSGVRLTWSDYEPVRYDRGSAPWLPNLSALDAIAHAGELTGLVD